MMKYFFFLQWLLLYTINLVASNVNIVSIAKFGANGLDNLDDTEQIQAGINYLHKKGGGILYFPKGVYFVSRQSLTKEATCLKLYPNIQLKGEGKTSSIKLSKNQPNYTRILNIVNSKNNDIKDLTFDGSYQNQKNPTKPNEHLHAIFIDSSTGVRIDGCNFYGTGGDGIYIRGPRLQSSDINISNCSFDDTRRNGITLGSGYRNVVIRKNYFGKKISRSPIDTEPNAGKCEKVLIEDNLIETNNLLTLGGVSANNLGTDQIVRNNVLRNCSIFVIYGSNVKIENNTITNSRKKAAITIIRKNQHISITNNKIYAENLSAIDIVYSAGQFPVGVNITKNVITLGLAANPCIVNRGGEHVNIESNEFYSKTKLGTLIYVRATRSMLGFSFINNKVGEFGKNFKVAFSAQNTINEFNIKNNKFENKDISFSTKERLRIVSSNLLNK